MRGRRRLGIGLAVLGTLSGVARALGPWDLEPRLPQQRNRVRLHPSEPERPRVYREPRPPPPEYAYWYWLEERKAEAQGRRDPWFLHGKRKTEGYLPQPGVALGEAWGVLPRPWPERAAPREIQRERKGDFPEARLAPEPGFAAGDRSYDYHPFDPRSDVRVHARDHGCEGEGCPRGDPHRMAWRGEPPRPSPEEGGAAAPGTADPDALRAYGERLFRARPAGAEASCQRCHHQTWDLGNVFDRYPRYDGHLNRVIGLPERVNLCRTAHQGCAPLPPGSRERLALLLYLRDRDPVDRGP